MRVKGAAVTAGVASLVVLAAACGGHERTARLASTTTSPTTSTTSASPVPTTTAVTTGPATGTEGAAVQLSVEACPTTFAVTPPPTSAPLPTSAAARLPAGHGGSLAFYSDSAGTMMVVGPAGWRCTANYGADGSGGVIVFPPGESVPASPGAVWHETSDSAVEAVFGTETSACQGCAVAQACSLFSSAERDYQSYFGRPCPVRAADEQTFMIGTGVMGFEDPAGVAGNGAPSGGRYPANGVMTYYPKSVDGSWVETCTLPPAQHGVCTVTLDAFVSAYGSR